MTTEAKDELRSAWDDMLAELARARDALDQVGPIPAGGGENIVHTVQRGSRNFRDGQQRHPDFLFRHGRNDRFPSVCALV